MLFVCRPSVNRTSMYGLCAMRAYVYCLCIVCPCAMNMCVVCLTWVCACCLFAVRKCAVCIPSVCVVCALSVCGYVCLCAFLLKCCLAQSASVGCLLEASISV